MSSQRVMINNFADRLEALLDEESPSERALAMSEAMDAAEGSGLIDSGHGSLRTTSSLSFVMDLLRDNPRTFDWFTFRSEITQSALEASDLTWILDRIR